MIQNFFNQEVWVIVWELFEFFGVQQIEVEFVSWGFGVRFFLMMDLVVVYDWLFFLYEDMIQFVDVVGVEFVVQNLVLWQIQRL